MPGDTAREPLLTRDFWALGTAELAYFTSVGVSFLALPLTVTGPLDSGEAGAGLAFGAFAVTALVCRPLAGRLADLHGRRWLMLSGALLCALGMVLVPHVGSLELLVVVRLLQGVAEAAFFVGAFALLADLAPPARMGEALSYNSLGLYLGIALGPPLGELVAEQGGLSAAWYVATGLSVLAAAITLLVREPPRSTDTDGHGRFIHWPAVPLSLGFLTSLVAVSGFVAFAALHADEIGMSNASLALFLYGGVVIVCRVVFARLPDRVPTTPLAVGSLATTGVGMGVMAAWQNPVGLLLGAVVMAVGVAFTTPAFFAAIFATARPSERGAASGTASLTIDLGFGLGPIGLGLVAQAYGIPWAFAIGALCAVGGALAMLRLGPRGVRSVEAEPPQVA